MEDILQEPTIKKLVERLSEANAGLEEIDRVYLTDKAKKKSEIKEITVQLAENSLSKARRAVVIRELYWTHGISIKDIADSFGIKQNEVRKLYGEKTINYPCIKNCGTEIFRSVKSWSDMKSAQDSATSPHWGTCPDCKEAEKQKHDEYVERLKRRNAELRAMTWDDFTDTKEWQSIKDSLIQMARQISGFVCEVCQKGNPKLRIYLHKETPQDLQLWNERRGGSYKYAIVCGGCVPRLDGIIHPERFEIVREEYLTDLWRRMNGR